MPIILTTNSSPRQTKVIGGNTRYSRFQIRVGRPPPSPPTYHVFSLGNELLLRLLVFGQTGVALYHNRRERNRGYGSRISKHTASGTKQLRDELGNHPSSVPYEANANPPKEIKKFIPVNRGRHKRLQNRTCRWSFKRTSTKEEQRNIF